MYFKSLTGNLHFLDSIEFEYLLPAGCVQITDAEADALRAQTTVTPSTVPSVVTMRQARLALLQTGQLTQVNTAVTNMPGPAGDAARITWEFSSEVQRDDQLVVQLAGALDLTAAQLDQLFTLAGGL